MKLQAVHDPKPTDPLPNPPWSMGDPSAEAAPVEIDGLPAGLPDPGPSLTRQTLTGVRLIAAMGILTKALSLIVQVVLGWLLLPKEFGLVAAAYGVLTVVAILRDAGATRFIIQRYAEYERLARPMLHMALGANLLAAIGLVAGGFLLERTGHEGVRALTLILAVSIVLRTPAVIWRARLQAQMKFSMLARIDVVSLLIQYGSTVALAWLGLGAKSLVLPGVAVAAWELLCLHALVAPTPGGRLTRPLFTEIFGTAKWIMLTTAGIALVTNGDYLALALLKSSEELGSYYFGFALSVAVAAIFATSLEGVLLPAFARARDDRERLGRAYRRAVSLSAVVIGAIAVGGAIATPASVHQIWQGKWDAAIPVAVIMFLSLSVRGQASAYAGLLEALGRWRLRMALVMAEGVGMFTAATIGALLGEISIGALRLDAITTVALTVGVFRLISGIALSQVGGVFAGVRPMQLLAEALPPVLIALAAAAVAWGTWRFSGLSPKSLPGGAAGVAAYLLSWLILSTFTQRPRMLEALDALRGRA